MKYLAVIIILMLLMSLSVFADKSMSQFNPNFNDMMDQALKGVTSYPNEYRENTQPFSLFFFADVHGDKTELERYCEFYSEKKHYFDDAFCAGDQMLSDPNDDWTFWQNTKGAENIMFVMGNHDLWYQKRPENGQKMLTDKEAYDKYYAPYVKGWNAVMDDGRTCFYKDYPEKKIRFMGINYLAADSDKEYQIEWFKKLLEDARIKGYTVIAATHCAPAVLPVSIESNWCEFDRDEGGREAEYSIPYCQAVKEFKQKGGKFAVWLAGHSHSDYLYVSKLFPDQLIMVIGETHRGGRAVYSQIVERDGTVSQDLANALVIDTTSKTLKAIRVGVHYDRYLRPINALAINYESMKIITQW